jgi:hypothetical protein
MMKTHSGGCQCGAVRYRCDGELSGPHICHCRMCQKAAGNFLMALVGVAREEFVITRGRVSWFKSSEPVRRGFCSACGTPLMYKTQNSPFIVHVTIGSLDDPAALEPVKQFGIEPRMPWLHKVFDLPGTTTEDDANEHPEFLAKIRSTNRRHPDRNTREWALDEGDNEW